MTPIYFPFTYVSKQTADVLRACFSKTIVYQPSSYNIPESMRQLKDKGLLDIRIPAKDDNEKLAEILREYKNWAHIHQGSGMSFFKTQTDNIPFYDEISAHQIRSDIKKKEKNQTSEQIIDPILHARIFLSMAQEFDINQWDITSELESFADLEKAFIEDLKGDKDSESVNLTTNQAFVKDEPGSHMTDQRIKSWINLLMCDPKDSNFYVTTSRDVMENLFEKSQEMEMVFKDAIPKNYDSDELKNNLTKRLENISKISGIDRVKGLLENKSGVLTVYRIFSCPRDYFRQYAGMEFSNKIDKSNDNKHEYTLIGIIEMA